MKENCSLLEIDVSICIVTYNSNIFIKKTIDSIIREIASIKAEIIIVDNNSNDNTVTLIRNLYPHIKIIHNQKNLGYAPAMNLSLKEAKGNFILTLSHDAELLPDSLSEMINFAKAHPKIGVIGPKTLHPNGLIISTLHHPNLLLSIWGEIIPIKKILRENKKVSNYLTKIFPNSSGLTSNYELTHEVDMVDGGCIFMRYEVLKRVGFLDPLLLQGPDDYDYCYRAKQAGFEIWYLHTSMIVHDKSIKNEIDCTSGAYLQMLVPQMCYCYSKYHTGFPLLFFKVSAIIWVICMIIKVLARIGNKANLIGPLLKAARHCINPEKYLKGLIADC